MLLLHKQGNNIHTATVVWLPNGNIGAYNTEYRLVDVSFVSLIIDTLPSDWLRNYNMPDGHYLAQRRPVTEALSWTLSISQVLLERP